MLELKRLKNARFGFPHMWKVVTGWALYDEERGGFVAFSVHRDKYGILVPYCPRGGKKALQSIITSGGFVNYNGIEFVKPLPSV